MKQLMIVLLFAWLLYTPQGVQAQGLSHVESFNVSDPVAASYEARSRTWWKNLELQLKGAVKVPYHRINAVTLQNIVFFTFNHPDKMNLSRTVPHLLAVYERHPDPAFRILALRSLQRLGDEATMVRIAQVMRRDAAGTVKRVATAVLVDYQRRQVNQSQ